MTQFTGPTVELFGSHFPKCTAVFHDMDVLFNLAKYAFDYSRDTIVEVTTVL